MTGNQAEVMLGYAELQRRASKCWSKKVQNRAGCIWGAGLSGELLYFSLLRMGARIELVIDSDSRVWGNKFAGCISIESPEALANCGNLDFICIASSSPTAVQEISKSILRLAKLRPRVLRTIDLWPEEKRTSEPIVPKPAQPAKFRRTLEQPLASDLRWMRQVVSGAWPHSQFTIYIEGAGSKDRLSATLASLESQIYPCWSAWTRGRREYKRVASGPGSASLATHRKAPGKSLVVRCRAGQQLPEHALFCLAVNQAVDEDEGKPIETRLIDFRSKQDKPHIPLLISNASGRDGHHSRKAAFSFPVILNKAPLRRFDPDTVQRIALLKVDHLGDAVMALPAILDVRKRYPKAFILLVAASWTKSFFEETLINTGAIDRIEIMDYFHERSASGARRLANAELARFAARLKPLNLDLAMDLRRHPENRPLLDAIPARWKLSFGDYDDASWLACPSASDAVRKDAEMHLGDELRVLFQAFAYGGNDSNLALNLDRDRVRNLVCSHIPSEMRSFPHMLGIAPGAGHPMKRWPIARFAELANLFVKRPDAGVLWFGSPSEADEIKAAISTMQMPERALSLAGKVGIVDFMHLASACSFFVGNDSGPAHMASVTGVPTLSIFSGQVSPFSVSSIGPQAFVLRPKPSCAPCYFQEGQCPYGRICMNVISPELAFRALQIIMQTTVKGNAHGTARCKRSISGV